MAKSRRRETRLRWLRSELSLHYHCRDPRCLTRIAPHCKSSVQRNETQLEPEQRVQTLELAWMPLFLAFSYNPSHSMSPALPDYGIDAPGVIRNLLLIGLGLLLVALFLPIFTIRSVTFALRRMEIRVGVNCLLEGLAMILYAKVGKFRHRDRMLGYANWAAMNVFSM